MTDVFTERPSSIDPPISDRQALGVLAIVAGIAAMAGPRRTRPLAGFLYGVALSRVHGAGRQRLETTLSRLFDEKRSVGAALQSHTDWHGEHDAEIERRLSTLERGRFVRAGLAAGDDTGGGACA